MIRPTSTQPTRCVAATAHGPDDLTRGKCVALSIPRALIVAFVWLTSLGADLVRACPDCSVARAARSEFWNQDFALRLGVVLAPFVIVALASVWADRIGRPPSNPS
jgi:hypothetical protein